MNEVIVIETVEDMVARANEQHDQCLRLVKGAVEHAIKVGDTLLDIESRCTKTQWEDVIAQSPIGAFQINVYMRLARYPEISMNAKGGIKGAARAIARLNPSPPRRIEERDPSLIIEAKRLRGEGMSIAKISTTIGISAPTVHRMINPATREQQDAARRRRISLTKFQRMERNAAIVKERGGDLSATYSLVRKALAECDRITGTNTSVIMHRLYDVEDAIIRAIKTT